MTNVERAEIAVIRDRSGSMESIREDMDGGLIAFKDEQAKLPGCVMSLYDFDDRFDVVFEGVPIAHAPNVPLRPRGNTALHDACGRAINMIGERLARMQEHDRPAKVIVVIITDGRENASREYSRAKVREMISHQRKVYGWEFVYLGADKDSYADADAIGVQVVGNYVRSASGARGAYGGMSANLMDYRSSGNPMSNQGVQNAIDEATAKAEKEEEQQP